MISVLIADDHTVVREGLKQIIAETHDMTIAGEASSGKEVIDTLKKKKCDILLLDIALPDRNGLDILKQLQQEEPKLPVLILTMYPEDQYALRVLKAGASGYLTKSCAPNELINAIRKVMSGEKYVSSSLAENLVQKIAVKGKEPHHQLLSDREYQVMCLIGSGKGVSDIAEELSLSVKTISTHRARILEKLKMTNTGEIIRYALEHKLVD
jgi:DNA-binding NarL/FixJ family response regulator